MHIHIQIITVIVAATFTFVVLPELVGEIDPIVRIDTSFDNLVLLSLLA